MNNTEGLPWTYSWQGAFDYETNVLGHSWKYTDRDFWSIGSGGPLRKLAETAKKAESVKDSINKALHATVRKAADWELVEWLADPAGIYQALQDITQE